MVKDFLSRVDDTNDIYELAKEYPDLNIVDDIIYYLMTKE